MRRLLLTTMALILLLTVSVNTTSAHPPHVTRYIETYSEIAIQEMYRSGIPASVTLAQGIHESSWGLGELSTNSNNHFGIKCKSVWNGPTYYIEDDDYENGKLVKSCFRVYNNVEESYIDHTNFLLEGTRYQSLFSYDKTDYINWSKGLKNCGYATDPNYDSKLIGTIEKYGLNKYDLVIQPKPQIVTAPIFHIPSLQPAPQQELQVVSQTDLTVPSAVVTAIQPAFFAIEDIPAAVNVEDYFRNANLDNNINTVQAMESSLEMEEEEEASHEPGQETSTGVLQPPSYQLTTTSSSAVIQTEAGQSAKLNVLVTEGSNLLLMKGETRVKKRLRR